MILHTYADEVKIVCVGKMSTRFDGTVVSEKYKFALLFEKLYFQILCLDIVCLHVLWLVGKSQKAFVGI